MAAQRNFATPDLGRRDLFVVDRFDPGSNFRRSLERHRIPADALRRFRRLPPVDRAIAKIANGVLGMPLDVVPPRDQRRNATAIDRAAELRRALLRPNNSLTTNTWRKLCWAVVEDMLTIGFGVIERQQDARPDYPFTVWPANAADIRINGVWDEQRPDDEPCFLDYSLARLEGGAPKEIWRENGFLIQLRTTTYNLTPPSPLEVAYFMVETWLGLSETQRRSADQQQTPPFMISLTGSDGEPLSEKDLKTFRDYWELTVVNNRKIPIVGNTVGIQPLVAQNDGGLYLQYTDYLLRIVSMAFGLTARDYNVTEHDNRATAGVAADSTWQDAVLPISQALREHFETEVIDYYEPEYELILTDKEPRGEEAECTTAIALFQGGVITRNEARRRAGEEVIGPAGDVFADGSMMPADPDAPLPTQEAQLIPEAQLTPAPKQPQLPGNPVTPVQAGQLSLFG